MAEASKDTDQSMEDILQSIKRIIADEGEPSPTIAGSDVLELTELLAEDVAVAPPPAAVEEAVKPVESMSIDEIMAAPMSATLQEAPVVPPVPQPAPVAAAPAAPVAADALMSDATLAASVAALNALSHTPAPLTAHSGSPAFRSGATVEDLVLEALRPMLKEWLDGNLPSMVKALVEKEIRRLSGQ